MLFNLSIYIEGFVGGFVLYTVHTSLNFPSPGDITPAMPKPEPDDPHHQLGYSHSAALLSVTQPRIGNNIGEIRGFHSYFQDRRCGRKIPA